MKFRRVDLLGRQKEVKKVFRMPLLKLLTIQFNLIHRRF